MRVIFLVNASHLSGGGHFFRCLSFWQYLHKKKIKCFFIDSFLENLYIKILDKNKICKITYEFFCKNDWKDDLLIIDSYEIDFHTQKKLSKMNIKILKIDDHASDNIYADFILNQNYKNLKEIYKDISFKSAKLLLGPDYCLLSYDLLKNRNLQNIKIDDFDFSKVLIFLSLSIDINSLKLLLEKIDKIKLINNVDIIFSGTDNEINNLLKIKKSNQVWTFFGFQNNFADFLSQYKFVIGSCGFNAYERSFLGIFSINFILADNQKYIAKTLIENKSSIVYENFEYGVNNIQEDLKCLDSEDIYRYRLNSFNLLDEKGPLRIINEIFK